MEQLEFGKIKSKKMFVTYTDKYSYQARGTVHYGNILYKQEIQSIVLL